jgi:hypothetical protein
MDCLIPMRFEPAGTSSEARDTKERMIGFPNASSLA